MSDQTQFYGLRILGAGESLADNGYQYTNADRQAIDRILRIGAEGHTHTGVSAASMDPVSPPELELDSTAGGMQAGIRIYYRFTLVDPYGFETAASPEAHIDTPNPVASPNTPALSTVTTGGTLTAGNYWYVLSAWAGVSTQETLAQNPGFVTVPATTSTNKVTITLPTIPSGASGFNVYRRAPGTNTYYFIQSIDETGAPITTFVDTGYAANTSRSLPATNSTFNTNNVTVEYPGATPVIPAGYTWKIYRTFVLNSYVRSVLKHVVDEVSPGVIDTEYVDLGGPTTDGGPPTSSKLISHPSKISFANEVSGQIPLGRMVGFPFVVTFTFPGSVHGVQYSETIWKCPFPHAQVVRADAQLGYNSSHATPGPIPTKAAGEVSVTINGVKISTGLSLSGPFWANAAFTITSGLSTATASFVDLGSPSPMGIGDGIHIEVDGDTGATPTAMNLTVEVSMIAYFTTLSALTTDWS